MTPSGVLIGISIAAGVFLLCVTVSVAVEEMREKNRIRNEWRKRTQKENEHE